MKPMNDKEVEAEILRIQTEIERWVKSQDLCITVVSLPTLTIVMQNHGKIHQ